MTVEYQRISLENGTPIFAFVHIDLLYSSISTAQNHYALRRPQQVIAYECRQSTFSKCDNTVIFSIRSLKLMAARSRQLQLPNQLLLTKTFDTRHLNFSFNINNILIPHI